MCVPTLPPLSWGGEGWKVAYGHYDCMQMPKMEFRSNAKPSLYSYPKPLKKEKETLKEKVCSLKFFCGQFSFYSGISVIIRVTCHPCIACGAYKIISLINSFRGTVNHKI